MRCYTILTILKNIYYVSKKKPCKKWVLNAKFLYNVLFFSICNNSCKFIEWKIIKAQNNLS